MRIRKDLKAGPPLVTLKSALSALFCLTLLSIPWAGSADVISKFQEIEKKAFRASTQLIVDNNDAWYVRWKLLSEAESTIDISLYSLHNDVFGKAFLGLLLKKAEEGVRIKLIVDAKATSYFTGIGKDYLEELASFENVEIKAYNPMLKAGRVIDRSAKKLMASLHDKFILVDGRFAITGGRNIGRDYFMDASEDPRSWRDTDIVLQGEQVGAQFKHAFEEEFGHPRNRRLNRDWFGNWTSKRERLLFAAAAIEQWMSGGGLVPESEATREWKARKALAESGLDESVSADTFAPDGPDMYNEEIKTLTHLVAYEPRRFDFLAFDAPKPIKVLDKVSITATVYENEITDNIIKLIDGSEREIYIQNPYVVMTPKMYSALKSAYDRGVNLIFHTNSPLSTDSLFTQAFFINDWGRLMHDMSRAKIYAFENRKLHSKVFVFDRKVSVVGTYNMDAISEDINSEIVTVVDSEAFSEVLIEKIESDIRLSLDLTSKTDPRIAAHPNEPAPEAVAPWTTKIILKLLGKLWFLRSWI